MLQFGARVVDAELPVDPGLFAIALLGPGRRFRRDPSPALDPAIQALAVQRTELQFRNVQPAPVFRRVHQVDAVVQPTGFGRRERGVERVTAVGVQVVAHQRDAFRIPVTRQIRQCVHLLRPIQRRAPLGDSHCPPAGQRLAEHPHRACSPAEVVGVVLLRRPGAYRQLLADFRHELLAHLVHAHHRMPRVVRPPVYLEHPLHAGHERVALLLRNAPHFSPPRF